MDERTADGDREHHSTRIDADAVRWWPAPGGGDRRRLLVLLHGYGADENDLFALAAQVPESFAVAAVRAPHATPWPSPGFAWYPIDDVIDGDLSGHDPSRVTDAASGFLAWMDASADRFSSVGLLGFSQGASVALQAMRLQPERFAFAVVLSGYAAPGAMSGDAALAERRPPVFWGRGGRDEVIPAPLIDHTAQWLPGHAALSGRLYPSLAHGVAEEEWADVQVFLERQIG